MKPRYLLDTNVCIHILKGAPQTVITRFAGYSVGEAVMSSITYAELAFGVAVAAVPAQEEAALDALTAAVPVVPFDMQAAKAYAGIRKATRENKKDQLDKLIAAHAVALGAIVVTNNQRDFARYPGVVTENWLS